MHDFTRHTFSFEWYTYHSINSHHRIRCFYCKTYTIVAEKTAAGAATTDNGAKSPATGVNTTAVAAVAAVVAAGAACAFVALRKNN